LSVSFASTDDLIGVCFFDEVFVFMAVPFGLFFDWCEESIVGALTRVFSLS
jgi:hypothetical protein